MEKERFPVLDERPYTIYNVGMSLDGRTSTIEGDCEFSGPSDWQRVHLLRHSVDGICVGINTVLIDDPKLRVKHVERPENPDRVVVDSRLRLPVDAALLSCEREGVRVFVGTTTKAIEANQEKVRDLESMNATVVPCGDGPRVHLPSLWDFLKKAGIDSMLVEGGGTLAANLFRDKLVDELRVFIAPHLVGGMVPPSTALVMDPGYGKVKQSINLDLRQVERLDDGIYARFVVVT